MSTAQLQAYLANAQQAYIELSSGAKVVTVSYTQGNGSKSVTYQQANLTNLTALIQQLQAQLGIIRSPRRPLNFVYGR
ncbi:phage head-tail adapter protein [Thioclava sp. BHET1]|nr:phage head-tail adapter protein [Thioclava sp. BHET1]